jgi:protein SCO1/2
VNRVTQLAALTVTLSLAIGAAALWARGRESVELPDYGSTPEFELTDEAGGRYTRAALLGKITIVDFIFTSCATACPLLTAEMARLQTHLRAARLDDRVRLLSISVDPERDTPARLAELGARHGADPRLWHFLRGSDQALRRVVVDGLKQVMDKQPDRGELDGFTILHGTRLVLLDEQARIRGFYDANDAEARERLRGDVAALATGRARLAPAGPTFPEPAPEPRTEQRPELR